MTRDNTIRKITVTGKTGTYYVTLPKDIIRGLRWRKGQKVIVEQRGLEIIIRDWQPHAHTLPR